MDRILLINKIINENKNLSLINIDNKKILFYPLNHFDSYTTFNMFLNEEYNNLTCYHLYDTSFINSYYMVVKNKDKKIFRSFYCSAIIRKININELNFYSKCVLCEKYCYIKSHINCDEQK